MSELILAGVILALLAERFWRERAAARERTTLVRAVLSRNPAGAVASAQVLEETKRARRARSEHDDDADTVPVGLGG